MKRFLTLGLLLSLLVLLVSCGKPSSMPDFSASQQILPGANVPAAGAQIALICTPEQQTNPFGQAVVSTLSRFSGEEGLTSAPYLTSSTEESVVISTLELAIKGGAEFVLFIGDEMIPALQAAQASYPTLYFALIGHSSSVELASNSTSVEFSALQAGWLAGYVSLLEGYRHAALIDTPDVLSQQLALGFLHGYNAAAEELSLPFGECTMHTIPYIENETPPELRQRVFMLLGTDIDLVFANDRAAQSEISRAAQQAGVPFIGIDTQLSKNKSLLASIHYNPKTALNQLLSNWNVGIFPGGEALITGIAQESVALSAGEQGFTPQAETAYAALFQDDRMLSLQKALFTFSTDKDGNLLALRNTLPSLVRLLPPVQESVSIYAPENSSMPETISSSETVPPAETETALGS